MELQDKIHRALGYTFSDSTLLNQALTHRSVSAENNERLEFLGDAILNYSITIELYRRFPKLQEGDLSRLRASLVKGVTLAEIARALSLGEFIKLGSGELKSGGHRRDSILADAFEAIIGAIHLDGGSSAAHDFILRFFSTRLDTMDTNVSLKDPKTRLQEHLQAKGLAVPEYKIVDVQGQAHAQTFTVECHSALLEQPQQGTGLSRRKAEQEAAQHTLEALQV